MGTDQDWEKYGASDPYYGVLTEERFRTRQLDDAALRDFFEAGEANVAAVFAKLERLYGPVSRPKRAVDFGCGVGRLLIPLAQRSEQAVGIDVSPSMLEEARRNCQRRQVTNVELIASDDQLSGLRGGFDLLHSRLVFQHIPVKRGNQILLALVDALAPSGLASVQLTYATSKPFERLRAVVKRLPVARKVHAWAQGRSAAPVMEMNSYDLSWVIKQLQLRGIDDVHLELSSYEGILFATLYLRKPER